MTCWLCPYAVVCAPKQCRREQLEKKLASSDPEGNLQAQADAELPPPGFLPDRLEYCGDGFNWKPGRDVDG